MYKVAIIGGGVVGGLVARKMAEYDIKTVILEKENDVATGQSKANSGIVHAGYDPKPGTLKAKLNVLGSQMMEDICKELGVKYRRNGALVVGFDDKDTVTIDELYEKDLVCCAHAHAGTQRIHTAESYCICMGRTDKRC